MLRTRWRHKRRGTIYTVVGSVMNASAFSAEHGDDPTVREGDIVIFCAGLRQPMSFEDGTVAYNNDYDCVRADLFDRYYDETPDNLLMNDFLMEFEVQASEPIGPNVQMVLYVDESGKGWARAYEEFMDGRFEQVIP